MAEQTKLRRLTINTIKRYAVFGQPAEHSLSPQLHKKLFAKNNLLAHYTRINARNWQDIDLLLKEFNLAGANITTPFKKDALSACNSITSDAKAIGGVNVIIRQNNKLLGFNTDWEGAMGAIFQGGPAQFPKLKHTINYSSANVLIIGAGPAAAAAVWGLSNLHKKNTVTVSSRTFSRAQTLANQYNAKCIAIEQLTPDVIQSYDIVLYAAADNVYYPPRTPGRQLVVRADYTNPNLYAELQARGEKTVFGLSWLQYQAIAGFEYYYKSSEFCSDVELTATEVEAFRMAEAKAPIILTGFSGSGKSYILNEIARQYGRLVQLDIDTIIEQKMGGLTPFDIIESGTEKHFRQLETDLLRQLLASTDSPVIALGAGGICQPINQAILRDFKARVIYVYSDLKTCLSRVPPGTRPLLSAKSAAELEAMYDNRKFIYFDNSDLIIMNN